MALTLQQICFCTLLFLLGISSAIDLKGASETPCFKIEKEAALSDEFLDILTSKTTYYPFISRLALYKITADLLTSQPPALINEGSMYYDGCIKFQVYKNGSMTSNGFQGKRRDYDSFVTTCKGTRFEPREGEGYYAGRLYVTLTDNKTFAVFPVCQDKGGMSWDMLSTTPTLTKANKEKIKRHVIDLGFSEEYFTEMRYDQCQPQQEQEQQQRQTWLY